MRGRNIHHVVAYLSRVDAAENVRPVMPKHTSWDHSITRLENSHHFRANSAVQFGPFMNAYRVVRSSRLARLFSFSLLDGLQVCLCRLSWASRGSLFGYAANEASKGSQVWQSYISQLGLPQTTAHRGSIETQTVHNLGEPIPLPIGPMDQPCEINHMAGALPLTMYGYKT